MSKKKKPTNESCRSAIIEQCVIYVQCLAAYDAGLSVDSTGDSEYAGNGRQISKAKRAMTKLIGLGPHAREGASPLSVLELHAKAAVLAKMYGLRNHEDLDQIEQAYVRFFAGEVSDFLAANHAVPS